MHWSATLLLLGSTLTLSGCVRLNASHCGNQGGAQMCQEQGKGDFCSICQAANDGCVDEAVEPVCDADDLDGDQTQGSGGTTSEDPSASSASQSETGTSSVPAGSTTQGDTSSNETTGGGSGSAGGSGSQTGDPGPTSTGGATDGTDTDTDTASPTSTSSGTGSTGTGADCLPAGTPCTPLAGECCAGLSCLTLDVLNPECG